GTADRYPTLRTSGPAAPPGGTDLSRLRVPDGRLRFEWVGRELWQRSVVNPEMSWKMSLVRDSVTPGNREYNAKAARAKLVSRDTATQAFGKQVKPEDRAHQDDEMMCVTCHTSWTTSCFGCHLPIQANWKSERQHYEGGETRNYATYNPQVVRDDFYMLGKHGEAKGNRVAPVRSTSALVLSSTNSSRERIYIQQPPVAASGFSSQAFAPHYPHTERKTETKTCTDCHLSAANDNNAWLASLLGQGTDFVDFVGFNAWVGLDGGVAAVPVTEWSEPQAVIGSYLHRYAYPDFFAQHELRGRALQGAKLHGAGTANCLQLRGEYLFVAEGKSGLRVYDAASIANKGFSQPLVTAPFSPLGHDTRVETKNATCVVLPTNQPIAPQRNQGDLMRIENQEQAFFPIYHYALVTDAVEGLIVVDVDTLADGEPRNNFLARALTWNPNGALTGARHATLAGNFAYIATPAGLAVADLTNPLEPRLEAIVKLDDVRASQVQFRYLFVTTGEGLRVLDVTQPARPAFVKDGVVPIKDAHKVHVARTYAYVAAGAEGVVVVDVENPARPVRTTAFDGGGKLKDARDVAVGSTNASLFAYVADAETGLNVFQLTAPDTQPKFYGFSPEPRPQWIAGYATGKPALALSKGLERDRAVDESGGQVAIFGRIGSRPFTLEEMQKLYLDPSGKPWTVTDR
ncbi:MAG: LVIVD repeat-containing protein, partial [Gammaproteobacteria bacterium]